MSRRALAVHLDSLTFVSSHMAARLETGFAHCDHCPPHRGENWSRPKRTAKLHKGRRPLSLSEVSRPVMAWELPMFDEDERFIKLNWEFCDDDWDYDWDVVSLYYYAPVDYMDQYPEVMTESQVIPRPVTQLPEPRDVVCIRGVDVYLD